MFKLVVLGAAGVVLLIVISILIAILTPKIQIRVTALTLVVLLVIAGGVLVLVNVLHDRATTQLADPVAVQPTSSPETTAVPTSTPPTSLPPSPTAPATTPSATDPVEQNTPTPTPASGPPLGTKLAGPDFAASDLLVTRTSNGADEADVDATGVSINGIAATDAWVARCNVLCSSSETAYVKINLGRKFTRLDAVFGVSDDSQAEGPVTVEVDSLDGAGAVLYTNTFTKSSGGKQEISVAGVLTLKVTFTGPLLTAHAAVGDPTAY